MGELIFGYSLVQATGAASRGLTLATHLSLTWILVQWWAHSSLHQSIGEDMGALLGIEYGFHVTIMLASLIIINFFVTVLRERRAMA